MYIMDDFLACAKTLMLAFLTKPFIFKNLYDTNPHQDKLYTWLIWVVWTGFKAAGNKIIMKFKVIDLYFPVLNVGRQSICCSCECDLLILYLWLFVTRIPWYLNSILIGNGTYFQYVCFVFSECRRCSHFVCGVPLRSLRPWLCNQWFRDLLCFLKITQNGW